MDLRSSPALAAEAAGGNKGWRAQGPDAELRGEHDAAVVGAGGLGTASYLASAHTFAHTVATGAPHPINAPFTLERFTTGRLIDEAAAAAVAHRGPAHAADRRPVLRGRPARARVRLRGRGPHRAPADPSSLTDEQWRGVLCIRTNARGPHRERWRHIHGCGRFFDALRDTVTDQVHATCRAGAGSPAGAPRRSPSILGKIEAVGPDAALFLERLYRRGSDRRIHDPRLCDPISCRLV